MRDFVARHRTSAAAKFFVFALSLAACLLMLEAGLRLAGAFADAGRERVFLPEEDSHDADFTFERYRGAGKSRALVLTLGDSLINGNNVPSRDSFPHYLYRSLAEAGTPAAVYNLSQCEESTFGVAAKLERYLDEAGPGEIPDAAVILVGAADLFNLPLARERARGDGSVWHDVLPRGRLYESRVYKLFRHLKTAWTLAGAGGRGEAGPTAEEKFALLKKTYERQKAAGGLRLSEDLRGPLTRTFSAEAERYRLDLGHLGDVSELLSDYAGRVYAPRLRYDEFFDLLLDMATTYPVPFWTGEFDAANFHFVQIYPFQSRFTARAVHARLAASAAAYPEIENSEGFRNFLKWLTDREEMDRLVDRERLEAWKRIVAAARAKGVRIVLQSYPADYKSANAMLARVADEYDLPLLDNKGLFERLGEKDGRAAYLEDNDHMTPAGNRVMGKKVGEFLAKEIFARSER